MAETFLAIPLKLDEKFKSVICLAHSLATCETCKLDFQSVNNLHRNFNLLPADVDSPPNKPPSQARSAQVIKMKESGNVLFKAHKYEEAANRYSLALEMALARPPWEPASTCREETAILLCNRSAARLGLQEFSGALADAEAVVQLKRPWPKGHFRKCKALQAMGRLKEAKEAIELGLSFDPNDNDCNLMLKEIKNALGEK
jgi:translocation protein SEC72